MTCSGGTTKKLWIPLILMLALGLLFWTSCGGHYTCNDTFSNNNCSSGPGSGGGPGAGGGGGGTPTTVAYAFTVDQSLGTMDGYTLSTSAFAATTGYTAPAIPLNDGGTGVVVAQKQFLYAVFAAESEIFGWSISNTGTLTAINGFPLTVAMAGVPVANYRQVSVVTNPAGTLLFIALNGSSQILVYQIGATGALTAAPSSPFSTGADSPINLGTDGTGKYLYASLDPDLATHTAAKTGAYVIGANGSLTAVPGSPFAYGMWEIQGDVSGQFLIGISGSTASLAGVDDDNIYLFSIAQTGVNAGAITQVAKFLTTYPPFNLAVNPALETIYTFSVNSAGNGNNPTEGFLLDTATSTLTVATGSPFSTIFTGGNGQFEQSGANLFAHSGDVNALTPVQLAPLAASSTTGVLTEPVAPVTLLTSGYWAVTDPQ
jgi:hypothetical protein